jgi:hypothetical protein
MYTLVREISGLRLLASLLSHRLGNCVPDCGESTLISTARRLNALNIKIDLFFNPIFYEAIFIRSRTSAYFGRVQCF